MEPEPAIDPAFQLHFLLLNVFIHIYLKAACKPAMDALITNPSWMEPMLPPEEGQRQLEDAAFDRHSRPLDELLLLEPDRRP
jgi:hypothetical protein